MLLRAGHHVELFATPGPNKAGELAQHAVKQGCTLILAAGGDGTINEAVNGMAGSEVPFGALPAGTANVLANEIGLSNRPDRAAAQLLQAEPRRISLGALDRPGHPRRHFVMMAGVGLDARIVRELDLGLKRRFGKLSYWHGGFLQLGRPVPRFAIEVAGQRHLASFALITKVRNYGGDFEIARRVKLTDDDFEVVVFENNVWQDYVRFLAAVILDRLYRTRGVKIYRAREISLEPPDGDPIYVQTDGESIGRLPARVTAVSNALTLLIPKRYADK